MVITAIKVSRYSMSKYLENLSSKSKEVTKNEESINYRSDKSLDTQTENIFELRKMKTNLLGAG